jgi:hypothetical protein
MANHGESLLIPYEEKGIETLENSVEVKAMV